MERLECEVVTPKATLFNGTAVFVAVPGEEGDMGFYAHHVPLVSPLRPGVVRVQAEEGQHFLEFAVKSGYVQVTSTKVTILCDEESKA